MIKQKQSTYAWSFDDIYKLDVRLTYIQPAMINLHNIDIGVSNISCYFYSYTGANLYYLFFQSTYMHFAIRKSSNLSGKNLKPMNIRPER